MKVSNIKGLLTATSIVVTLALVSTQASARIDSSTEAKLVKICAALKSDSRIKLHRTIKQSRLGYKQIAEGLKCNGVSAMEFALMHNAKSTADLLARKSHIRSGDMLAKR